MPWLVVDASLAALGSIPALERLAARDAQLVDKLPTTDAAVLQRLEESKGRVSKRLRTLARRLAISFLSMGSAFAVAYLSNLVAVFRLSGGQLGTASAFVFAVAGLSRLGWHEGSFKGTTTIERLDTAIFQTMCWYGMYLASLAIQ